MNKVYLSTSIGNQQPCLTEHFAKRDIRRNSARVEFDWIKSIFLA